MRLPLRAAWRRNDPEAFIAAVESVVKRHPSYAAAKAGDLAAAWRLTADIMSGADIARLRAAAAGATAVLPVHAVETNGVNEIPGAMAAWVGRLLGLPVHAGVVQINRVGHTGSSGWHRMASQALFEGDIERGASYLVLDDFVGQGGTFANLRGHVLARGGRVSGFVAMTGKPRSAKIALQPETLDELRRKHGELEPWWSVELGFDFGGLTQSEAEYLLRVDADTIRSRMAEARQRAGP